MSTIYLGEDLKTSNRRAWMDFLKSFGVWIVESWASLVAFVFFAAVALAVIWAIHYTVTKPSAPPAPPDPCITSARVIQTGYSHLCPGGTVTTEKLTEDKVLVRCTCSPPPDPDAEP